jgi:hypothetical protein
MLKRASAKRTPHPPPPLPQAGEGSRTGGDPRLRHGLSTLTRLSGGSQNLVACALSRLPRVHEMSGLRPLPLAGRGSPKGGRGSSLNARIFPVLLFSHCPDSISRVRRRGARSGQARWRDGVIKVALDGHHGVGADAEAAPASITPPLQAVTASGMRCATPICL